LQRRQMTTIAAGSGGNKTDRVVAFQGGGDDMDAPIKKLMTQQQQQHPGEPLNENENATSIAQAPKLPPIRTGVNSYNIGRPIAQTVHYIWTYLRVAEHEQWDLRSDNTSTKPLMDFILPTGAMGNVAAGYMAQRMGLPIRKFVLAVNVNDITHRAVQTGKFYASDTMHKTLSDAINIQVPYNFERLLYYLTDGDHQQVARWYNNNARSCGHDDNCNNNNGGLLRLDLGETWLTKLQSVFDSARVTDEALCAALRRAHESLHYLADPHTAVALSAAEQLGYLYNDESRSGREANDRAAATAVLATASPCKFEHSVTTALGPEAWRQYYHSDQFPKAARTLMEQPEQAPILYPAVVGDSLSETQQHWEGLLQAIVTELESGD
jgi:threonine synthase